LLFDRRAKGCDENHLRGEDTVDSGCVSGKSRRREASIEFFGAHFVLPLRGGIGRREDRCWHRQGWRHGGDGAAKVAPWVGKAGKVLAPIGQLLGKIATPLAFIGAGVQWATAKTTKDYVDAGVSTVSAGLMAAPHPIAKAAGGGPCGWPAH
jgi:hypothetical protein